MSENQSSSREPGMERFFFRASAADFKRIPGCPIAYWMPHALMDVFAENTSFNLVLDSREGLTTGNNEKHVRYSFEVSLSNVYRNSLNRNEAQKSHHKWFPYNKGGELRKWYGNDYFVVNWKDDGHELQNALHPSGDRIWAHNFNLDYIFKPFISWSDITTKGLSARAFPIGYIFDATGLSAFERNDQINRFYVMGICNSRVGSYIANILNPTMHFKSGDFAEMPFVLVSKSCVEKYVLKAVEIAALDWMEMETSWNFVYFPLLQYAHHQTMLQTSYQSLCARWRDATLEMQRLETDNNRIFIAAYGLQDELTPDVPLSEITLTCNPHYRYGGSKTTAELEALLQADTLREFLSYAVGCMFGRYSPDKPGLILANAGDALADYLAKVPNPSFMPDDDNVIPLLDGDWFTDDITERFRSFLRVTFGEPNYSENQRFIESALGKDLRKYFVKDFYADHVKRYKKRPIYWLFTSPKGTFNALIYLHRYRPDTASVVLHYLREFRTKLVARRAYLDQVSISSSASQAEKTKALKEIDTLKKQVLELGDYERDTLFPLASAQVPLDLDDGVKVNYLKLGAALKKITGLDAKDDE